MTCAFGVVLGACNDPAEWRPARGVADLPAEPSAKRVSKPDAECTSIGVVEHATSVKDVETTVARHGGTHFVVTDVRDTSEYVTGQSAPLGGATYGSPARLETTKHISAEAYRCPAPDVAK